MSTTRTDQPDRVARTASAKASLVGTRVGLAVFLVLAAWGCLLSASDRAGLSLTPSYWGTSTPLVAAANALNQGDTSQAIAAAETLVHRNPTGRSSASVLAEALSVAGQAQRSAQAFQIALTNGWRDPEAQAWAIEAALFNQDLRQAVAHLDALLRISGDVASRSNWLVAIEASRAGRIALAERLSHSPRWSSEWLRTSADLPRSRIEDRIETLQMARSRGLNTTAADAARATWRLIDSHPEQALAFWIATSGEGDSKIRGIWDADFVRSSKDWDGGPFEWRRRDGTGVQVRIVETSKGPGLEISGLSVTTGAVLETLISLGPGIWRLSWQQSGTQNVRVVPACSHPGSSIARNLYRPSTGNVLRFSVPGSCPIQKISIVLFGDTAPLGSETISGISILPDSLP